MATYYGTYGQKVQYLASDPSDPQIGQVWYNSTSATLKVRNATTAGTFASGGNLGSGGYAFGYAGTQTAGLLAWRIHTDHIMVTLLFTMEQHGQVFQRLAPTQLIIQEQVVQTAAIFAGGYNQPSSLDVVNTFNGTTFTPQTAIPSTRANMGGAGTQTAMLIFGGGSGYLTTTNEWDGSSWTVGGNLNTARQQLGGSGIQTAALAFGGVTPSVTAATELYNGTAWTNNPTGLNTARCNMAGYGTQTSTGAFGGSTPSPTSAAEIWNGTTWSTNPNNMPTTLNQHRGCGTVAAGLSWGGSPGLNNNTLEFTGPGIPQTQTVTVS